MKLIRTNNVSTNKKLIAATYLGINGIAMSGVFFPVTTVLVAATVTLSTAVAVVANAIQKHNRKVQEERDFPKYHYTAPDGSQITVDPERQQVTRRLSKDFARAADFRHKTVSDVVTKGYFGNPITRRVRKLYDRTLRANFNKHANVNTRTFKQAREYDEGATEVFIMEKYLQHAQAQYQKDKAVTEARKTDGMSGAAPAKQARKNKNAPGI